MPKVIVITGTSTGLGLALAVQLAGRGHHVHATMRNLDKRTALDAAAAAAGVTLGVSRLDVQDTASVETAIGAILAAEGRIDTLINNAGGGFVRSTEQASEAQIAQVLDLNLMGTIRCTKAVLSAMRQARSGHVINISSVGGLVGQPFNEIYCAAKFAVEGYTESLASYVTPSFGINFTAVEPGGISTEFVTTIMSDVQATGGVIEDEYKPILEAYLGGARRRGGSSNAYQTADEAAAPIVGVVEATDPPVRIRTSAWAEEFTRLKTVADPDGKLLQRQVIERFLS